MGRTAPATHEFCSLCNCRVPLQNGGWRTHEQGIRHRRNAASQKLTGQPGAAVVSTFEDLSWVQTCSSNQTNNPLATRISSKPQHTRSQQQQQQQTRHNHRPHLHQQQRPSASSAAADGPSPAEVDAALSSIHLQLRKHVATHAGVGPTYQLSLSRFESTALRTCLATLQQGCQQSLQQGAPAAGGAVLMDAMPGGAAPHMRLMVSRQSGAVLLAAAAVLLRTRPQLCSELSICVPYQTHGPEAIAATAALSTLLTSLAHQRHLVKLRVLVDPSEYRSVLLQGGTGTRQLTALWGGVLGSLRQLLGRRMLLEELQLSAPPGVLDPHDLAELNTTLLLAPRVVRSAVLLGLHPRVGGASLLRRLPGEVVGEVLERGVPQRGCVLVLKTPSLLADTSSSEGEDSGTSGTSGSDDSDDSDSEAEEEGSEEAGGSGQEGSSSGGSSSVGDGTESGSSSSSSGSRGRRHNLHQHHQQQQEQQQRRVQQHTTAAGGATVGGGSGSRQQQVPYRPLGRGGAAQHLQGGGSGSGSNRRGPGAQARQLQQLDLTAAAAAGAQRRRASQGGGCSSGGDSPASRGHQQRHVGAVGGGVEAGQGDMEVVDSGRCSSDSSDDMCL